MLEIDIPTILFEIINFLALTAILYFLVFRRIMESINQQNKQKDDALKIIMEEKEQAEAYTLEMKEKLDNLDVEAAKVVKAAQDQIDRHRMKLMDAAHIEAERLLKQAYREKEQIQEQAIEDYYEEIMDVVIKISSDLIGKNAPQGVHDEMVAELVKRVWDLGRNEMEQVTMLRRAIGERTLTMYVESARPLSNEQQLSLIQTFSALADQNVKAELKINPALGVGLKVRLGDIILDNTIHHQLANLEDKLLADLKGMA